MVVAPALAALGELLALAVLIGLLWAYRYTLGAVLLTAAFMIGSIRLPGFLGGGRVLGFAADAIVKADHAVRHALGRGVTDMQAAFNETVSYLAYSVHWIGKEIASLSHDTAQAIEAVTINQIPKWLRKELAALAAFGPLGALIYTLRHQIRHALTVAAQEAWHLIRRAEHTTIAKAVATTVPVVLPRISYAEREIGRLTKGAANLAKYLTPAAVIGLIGATIFKGYGLGWLRCKGVGRVGRALCGMTGLIEAMALDALTAFAAIDLCWFVRGVESAATSIRPLLLTFVDLENALIGKCGGTPAAPLSLSRVSPTPVVDALTLKAL